MYQLSSSQKSMYDTHQFYNNTPISNIGICVFFKSTIKPAVLDNAVNKLIELSDGLRLCITSDGQSIKQHVSDYKREKIEIIKLQPDTYQTELEKFTLQIFDIYNKLYDFKIILVDEKIGLYIKLHHVIADAWCMSVVISSLLNILDQNNVINELPSYIDFISAENEYKQGKKYIKDSDYWKSRFPAKPDLITLSPGREISLDVSACRSSFDISSDHATSIKTYCHKHEISLAVLFEAAVSLYAARVNQTNDVTLCSMVLNRNGHKEKNTIGMFSNIIPLSVSIDDNESFSEFCSRISDNHMESFRHQKFPLEDIFSCWKSQDKSPIYDIMVSYQSMNTEWEQIESAEWLFNGTSDLGFMVNISERTADKIHIDIDWRKNQFTSDEVDNIQYRLLDIILKAASNENILVRDISIATEKETDIILHEFNNTDYPYPRNNLLHQYLEEYVVKNPDKIALRFNGQYLTFNDFNCKVNAVAHKIMQIIPSGNHTIGIAFERSFEMMIAIYAVLKCGCAYMPIDPHFPTDRIDFMVQDSGTPIILTQVKFASLFEGIDTVALDEFDYTAFDSSNLNLDISSNDTAYVIYTSGSTGKPKGAMIAHHSVINRIQWMHNRYPLGEHDVILQKTPYTFDVSVWELFWWSMYNGSLNILVPEGHKDPSEIIKGVYDGHVTHIHFVPSMLNAFLEYIERIPDSVNKLSSLKYVFASGEALQSKHVETFYHLLGSTNATLNNLYGPTECTVDVSYYDCDSENIPESIPIGKPIDNTQLLVLDKYQNILPVGVVGELYISGVGVGKGYLKREELTKEKFVPNPFGKYPVMYKSGDLAKWLPDGNIEYCGRCDFQIKIRGLRVELGDIENALLMISSIKQVLVTAPEINGEQHLCAYYTAEQDVDSQIIIDKLSEKLPDYMVPQFYVQLPSMPVNNNGKIDRKQLPIPVMKKEVAVYAAPTNQVEEKIQQIVQQILNADKVSCTENLIDSGLTSLGIISMVTHLSAEGYNCKVRDIYEHKTICGIAKAINASQSDEADYSADTQLYADISDIADHTLPKKQGTAVFITGATGFLGIHIIRELYSTTDKKMYCLVRNKQKLADFIRDFTDINYPNDRIIPIVGDITKEQLGVDNEMIDTMKADVSDIIHCAADVSFFCAWERAKSINYMGTCNVISFAEAISAKLHHMSTMSVSGDLLVQQTQTSPDFTEDRLFIGQKYKDNVYVHSKYLAETAVIKAIRENRINASIYRIANITWRVEDGKFQKNYADNDLYILTKVMQAVNCYPSEIEDEDIAITPIDDLAKAICSQLECEHNRIYHLYSDHSFTLGRYMEALGVNETKSLLEYIETVKACDDDYSKFALMYISGIMSDVNGMIVHFKKTTTPLYLAKKGVEWSCLDENYIKVLYNIN